MQTQPAPAGRGHDHRARSPPAPTARSSSSAASTSLQADILDAAVEQAYAKGYLGERHLRLRHPGRAGRPPRRGRLHLRRGVGAARRARGQARQPAPEAAVPGQPGPLPGPDADQQRRDALQHADHHREGRRVVPPVRRRQTRPAPRWSRSPATSSGRATTRSSWASPRARSSTASPAARRRGARSSAGSRAARRRRCCCPRTSTSPTTFESMAEAGSMLGSGAIIVVDDSIPIVSRRAAAGRLLPPRVVRQVRAVPRGHQLDREDARADRSRRGDADGHRDRRRRPGEHHRQLPLRARRLDGDADRLDDQALPRRSSRRTSRPRASAPSADRVGECSAVELASAHAGPGVG